MAKTCGVCSHRKRKAIDQELLAGRPLRDISAQYGPSRSALNRHKEHVSETVARAHDAAEVVHADSLLDMIKAQRDRALRVAGAAERILNDALADGDRDTALNAVRAGASALREVRGVIELFGRVVGEIEERQRVTVTASVDMSALSNRELELIAAGDANAIAAYHKKATPATARQLMRQFFGDVGPREDMTPQQGERTNNVE